MQVKKTEGWLAAFTTISGALVALGIIDAGTVEVWTDAVPQIIGGVIMLASTLGYGGMRTSVKKNRDAAKAATPGEYSIIKDGDRLKMVRK